MITCDDEDPDESRWGIDPYDDESLARAVGALDDGDEIVHLDSELRAPGPVTT